MKNWHYQPPGISKLTEGILFLIVNNVPEVSMRVPLNAMLQVCDGAHKNDPFCVVYMQDDGHHWYKGEYCYANQRYNFSPVGLAAIPDVILMMQVVMP